MLFVFKQLHKQTIDNKI